MSQALHDLRTEDDPVAIAQGALLLCLSGPNDDLLQDNSTWLNTAIQYAKICRANRCDSESVCPTERNIRKRLWWCCVIRDRLISLGMRRPLQITPESFDPDQPLEGLVQDLQDESGRSIVHDFATKRQLADLFLLHIGLVIALTDTLMAVYPPDGAETPQLSSLRDYADAVSRIQLCKSKLERWSHTFSTQFPQSRRQRHLHRSAFLCGSLLTIYHQ